MTRRARMLVPALLALLSALAAPRISADEEADTRVLMKSEAAHLDSLVTTAPARAFLAAVSDLPAPGTRTVYWNKAERQALTEAEAAARNPDDLAGFDKQELDEQFYYNTRYGTPLAFVRPLDIVGGAGLGSLAGRRVLDFGFGSIGQLRLMASLGADVTGIEVDPLLQALYGTPADTGAIAPSRAAGSSAGGRLHLLFGSFPGEAAVARPAGGGYDVIVSKNTLKRGYIHPEREVDPRMLVHLGVDDSTFIGEIFARLKPGGLFLIYNLCPARSKPDEAYKPWSDGRCPFERGRLESAGFTVLAYDQDDTPFARRMGAALGWGDQMNLETDLFGTYTLVRR